MEKNCLVCGTLFKKRLRDSYKYFETKRYCCSSCYGLSIRNKKRIYKERKSRITKQDMRIEDEVIYITKTQGNKIFELKFSLSDIDFVSSRVFTVSRYVYFYDKRNRINVASYLLGKKDGCVVDHINRDKLDNRRENLRFATFKQNMYNRYCKGFSFDNSRKKYISHIRLNGKTKHLGRFDSEDEARNAYIKASKLFFGEYSPF